MERVENVSLGDYEKILVGDYYRIYAIEVVNVDVNMDVINFIRRKLIKKILFVVCIIKGGLLNSYSRKKVI